MAEQPPDGAHLFCSPSSWRRILLRKRLQRCALNSALTVDGIGSVMATMPLAGNARLHSLHCQPSGRVLMKKFGIRWRIDFLAFATVRQKRKEECVGWHTLRIADTLVTSWRGTRWRSD